MSTIVNVRFVVTPHASPYEGETDHRKALALALDDFYLSDQCFSARACYWLTGNVLEAKVVPYEAER